MLFAAREWLNASYQRWSASRCDVLILFAIVGFGCHVFSYALQRTLRVTAWPLHSAYMRRCSAALSDLRAFDFGSAAAMSRRCGDFEAAMRAQGQSDLREEIKEERKELKEERKAAMQEARENLQGATKQRKIACRMAGGGPGSVSLKKYKNKLGTRKTMIIREAAFFLVARPLPPSSLLATFFLRIFL